MKKPVKTSSDPELLEEYDLTKSVPSRFRGKVPPGAKLVQITKEEAERRARLRERAAAAAEVKALRENLAKIRAAVERLDRRLAELDRRG
ncbi:MAG: hypothetical protein AB1405_15420 [Bdellovibrionota bacterium]